MLQLVNGDFFNPDKPCVWIGEKTIAQALSKICRFSGHCKFFYSVAQHSNMMFDYVCKVRPDHLDLQLATLLHDAHECLTGYGDVISGYKNWGIKQREHQINEWLAKHYYFDVRWFQNEYLKTVDRQFLYLEHEQLMVNMADDLDTYHPAQLTLLRTHVPLIVEEPWRLTAHIFESNLRTIVKKRGCNDDEGY